MGYDGRLAAGLGSLGSLLGSLLVTSLGGMGCHKPRIHYMSHGSHGQNWGLSTITRGWSSITWIIGDLMGFMMTIIRDGMNDTEF